MAQRIATTKRMKTDATGGAISVVAITGGKAKQ